MNHIVVGKLIKIYDIFSMFGNVNNNSSVKIYVRNHNVIIDIFMRIIDDCHQSKELDSENSWNLIFLNFL